MVALRLSLDFKALIQKAIQSSGAEQSAEDVQRAAGRGFHAARDRITPQVNGSFQCSGKVVHCVRLLTNGFFRGCVLTVLREALDEAGVSPADIDAVAFTKGPGMTICLVI